MLKLKSSSSAKAGENLRARGDAARDRYNWAEAVELYRRHLEKEPADEPIWVQLGHCEKEAGYLGKAERSYLRALSLEPSNADTYVHLGHIEKLGGRAEQALAWYRKALIIDPAMESALHEVREAAIAVPLSDARETSAPSGDGAIERRLAEMADQIGAIKAVAVELQRLRRHVEGLDAQTQQLTASMATLSEKQATMQDEHLGRLSALEAGAPALQLPFPALLAQLSELTAQRTEIDTCRNRIDAVEMKLRAAER